MSYFQNRYDVDTIFLKCCNLQYRYGRCSLSVRPVLRQKTQLFDRRGFRLLRPSYVVLVFGSLRTSDSDGIHLEYYIYHARMRLVMRSVASVYVCVCLSVCPVRALTVESLNRETSLVEVPGVKKVSRVYIH